LIDTHAHLDACAEPPDALIVRAHEHGVDRILTIGSGIDSCREALALAKRYGGVRAVLGIHPHLAAGTEADRLAELLPLLGDPEAVAVGEIGLDFFRDLAPPERQVSLFRAQLELASSLGKPVVIHSRDADSATADTLAGFEGTVVLHCFSSPGLLPVALERRYYISFAGNLTYPKAEELRLAATRVPADRLLVETDSPYLAPQPRRGRPNEPANVRFTLEALAAARSDDAAALVAQIDTNAAACFGLT